MGQEIATLWLRQVLFNWAQTLTTALSALHPFFHGNTSDPVMSGSTISEEVYSPTLHVPFFHAHSHHAPPKQKTVQKATQQGKHTILNNGSYPPSRETPHGVIV